MKLRIAFVFLLVWIPFFANASSELKQDEASAIISGVYNKNCLRLRIGNGLVSTHQNPSFPSDADPDNYVDWWMWSEDDFGLHRVLAEAGIFEIQDRQSVLGDNWREVTIELSPKAQQLVKEWGTPERENTFCLKRGTLRVTNIGRNELYQKGLDNYRVLMGLGEWEFTEETKFVESAARDAMADAGVPPPEADLRFQKFIVLLKHDPFRGEWRFVTGDMVQVDEEFQGNRVLEYLQRR